MLSGTGAVDTKSTGEIFVKRIRLVERALFLIGEQNSGKSTQLRSMFLDRRLGKDGMIPTERSIPRSYALSNERRLYLRLTSPHEADEDLSGFLATCDSEMWPGKQGAQRWNFAGALQMSMTEKLRENPAEIIEAFKERFFPERLRVAILSPDRRGWTMEWSELRSLTKDLRKTGSCEVMAVDATDRIANGYLYADFFDFS